MAITLNCDMGESFGIWQMEHDEALFPHVDMANLACGFHAGDALTMRRSVALAAQHSVTVGAHIAYQDLVGFGRRSMQCSSDEITAKSLYQIGALEGICAAEGIPVSYVKPHGALYHDMMREERVFRAILEAVAGSATPTQLMVLSTTSHSHLEKIAGEYGVELIAEVFADRNYSEEGSLVPRTEADAIIADEAQMLQRVETLTRHGYLESREGKPLHLRSDTICVHGDTPRAVAFVQILASKLRE